MKKAIAIIVAVFAVFALASCSATAQELSVNGREMSEEQITEFVEECKKIESAKNEVSSGWYKFKIVSNAEEKAEKSVTVTDMEISGKVFVSDISYDVKMEFDIKTNIEQKNLSGVKVYIEKEKAHVVYLNGVVYIDMESNREDKTGKTTRHIYTMSGASVLSAILGDATSVIGEDSDMIENVIGDADKVYNDKGTYYAQSEGVNNVGKYKNVSMIKFKNKAIEPEKYSAYTYNVVEDVFENTTTTTTTRVDFNKASFGANIKEPRNINKYMLGNM